ncbi:aspartyl-phosphate phosphatase Spo0E family protein [Phosphitispora sp. TUW77]|uniref:aspartyl-phosphate phosphatase Spo0E family protein n=1 Tax=Phosphitispora sp. TUW77 TaxID=3152361 RepID=UPI003AB518AA
MEDLVQEIEKLQQELITLAEEKNNILSDPEIYRYSCIIDNMIVQFMKFGDHKAKN